METNRLKRFASEARNILMNGVRQRLTALGFQTDGSLSTKLPELMGGGSVFMGEVQSEDFYHKWMSLFQRIQSHSYREVAEEAAYTWFNRLMAIRIMVKNELVPAVLEYESDEMRIPLLVSEARQRRFPQMNEESRQKLEALLNNDALTDEQFAVLIVAYCHSNPIIHKCFGTISDYTELLLPSNILAKDGFIDKLNADEYISDEDYRSPELIGWLYQFYISERKDEVFAKKGKFETDEIPAATQIFTPNWIVKYMVQNTVGRIYLDNNPYSDIKEGMQYLVEPTEPTPADAIYRFEDIHDLTCADLACGSGHILNECFDLLYQIYIEEGYNRKKAVEDIFLYNLTGIDIDMRAKQLATFALLMKACQKDISFADAHCMPRVLDMPVSFAEAMGKTFDSPLNERAFIKSALKEFIMSDNAEMLDELTDAIQLMNDAQTLGSIMKFNISERTRNVIAVRTAEYEQQEVMPETIQKILPYIRIILALTQNYAALMMNPPYMGGGNMNEVLGKYVKDNYADSKADLFSVFMDVSIDRLCVHGKYGMINMQSWMFLSSFEKLRKKVLGNYQIDSMLHLGPRTFDELSGEVVQNTAFVICKNQKDDAKGIYYRLVDGKSCSGKKQLFLNSREQGSKIYYPGISQSNFEKIPGCPIGYWVSEKMINIWNHYGKNFTTYADPRVGLDSGDNSIFLRLWQEVSHEKIGFNYSSSLEFHHDQKDYVPHTKGGTYRKWYGNLEYILRFNRKNYDLLLTSGNHLPSRQFYFKEGSCWSRISSGSFSLRYNPKGFVFNSAAPTLFSNNHLDLLYIQSFLTSNSSKQFLSAISPTLNYQAGEIRCLPIVEDNKEFIVSIVEDNIAISKQDWDAHETSWDFTENEFVKYSKRNSAPSLYNFTSEGENIPMESWTDKHFDFIKKNANSLECLAEQIKADWEDKFMQLHHNEEELNRQFIEIYGLQDELTPDVPLSEITILQQGEISIEQEKITDNGRGEKEEDHYDLR